MTCRRRTLDEESPRVGSVYTSDSDPDESYRQIMCLGVIQCMSRIIADTIVRGHSIYTIRRILIHFIVRAYHVL